MDKNPIDEGRFTENAHGLGTVTEEMVLQRARELAVINGRTQQKVLDGHIEQARRELTGKEHLEPEMSPAENLTEDQRWQPVPESTGQAAPTVPPSDEQTFAEELVEEGLEDAEQDQMVRATRESLKHEPPSD